MRPRHLVAVAVPTLLTLAGCGGGKPPISDEAARALQQKVREVRIDAAEANADGVQVDLDQLRRLVLQYKSSGDITDQRAQEVLDAARVVAGDPLTPSPSPTSASSSPQPTTPPPTSASPTPSPTPSTTTPPPPPPTSAGPTVSVTVGTGLSGPPSAKPSK